MTDKPRMCGPMCKGDHELVSEPNVVRLCDEDRARLDALLSAWTLIHTPMPVAVTGTIGSVDRWPMIAPRQDAGL